LVISFAAYFFKVSTNIFVLILAVVFSIVSFSMVWCFVLVWFSFS